VNEKSSLKKDRRENGKRASGKAKTSTAPPVPVSAFRFPLSAFRFPLFTSAFGRPGT
jgi:hypothetical protein